MPFIGNKPSAVPLTSADIADSIITSAKIVDATITNSDVASSIITGQTAETSIAGGDSVLIYDDSASALRKMTRTNFVAGIGGVNTPAFYAYKSTSQTITSGVITKIDFGTEDFDTNSNFASSRFTPTTAGKYYIETGLTFQGGTSYLIDARIYIYKNGTQYTLSYCANQNNNGNYNSRTWSSIIDLNGSSDYVEIYANSSNSNTNTTMASGRDCWFQGFKLIE